MTDDIDDLLEERRKLKNKKPDFNRQDHGLKDRVGAGWRKPKGHHNKKRLNKRGHATPVSTGWGSPKEVRGLHPSGYEPIRVHNTDDLDDVEDGQGAIIASNVGDRKRVAIIEQAQENDIPILNLDAQAYLEDIKSEMEERRETSKEEQTDETDETDEQTTEEKGQDPEEHMEELEDEKETVLTKK